MCVNGAIVYGDRRVYYITWMQNDTYAMRRSKRDGKNEGAKYYLFKREIAVP
jgi:hypothetical protein